MDNGVAVYPRSVTIEGGTGGRAAVTVDNDLGVALAYRVKCNQSQLFAILPDAKGTVSAHSRLVLSVSRRPGATTSGNGLSRANGQLLLAKLLLEFIELPPSVGSGKASLKKFWASLAGAEGVDDCIHTKLVEVWESRERELSPTLPVPATHAVSDPNTLHALALLARAAPASPSVRIVHAPSSSGSKSARAAAPPSPASTEAASPRSRPLFVASPPPVAAEGASRHVRFVAARPEQPAANAEARADEPGPGADADADVDVDVDISPRIMTLLVKNVSPNDPLSPPEVAELRGFRADLSKSQWRRCLEVARGEKTRREELLAYRPPFRSSTVMPALQALHAEREALQPPLPPAALLGVLQRAARSIGLEAEEVEGEYEDEQQEQQEEEEDEQQLQQQQQQQEAAPRPAPAASPARTVAAAASPLARPAKAAKPTPPPRQSLQQQQHQQQQQQQEKSQERLKEKQHAIAPLRPRASTPTPTPFSASASASSSSSRHAPPSMQHPSPSPAPYAPSPAASRDAYASDLARSSSLRVDAACAAAKCLMSSLQADALAGEGQGDEGQRGGSVGGGGGGGSGSGSGSFASYFGASTGSYGGGAGSVGATLSVLGAMVLSLEKSRDSMERLADLGDGREAGEEGRREPSYEPWEGASGRFRSPARSLRRGAQRGGDEEEEEEDDEEAAVPESPAHLDALPSAVHGLLMQHASLSSPALSDQPEGGSHAHLLDFNFEAKKSYYERRLPGEAEGGYHWKGQRFYRGLGALARVCVDLSASLPRDFPVRLCGDTASVDVVWREQHSAGQGQQLVRREAMHSAAPSASVLRRERFAFDDVMAGPGSADRLDAYMRHRARRALQRGRGLAVVVLACGDACREPVEPTVALVLGAAGGQSLAGAVVDEIFSYLAPAAAAAASSKAAASKGRKGSNHQVQTAARAEFLAARLVHEQAACRVMLSAVVLCDGQITDLLGKARAGGPACRLQRHQPSGAVYIAHAAAVQLRGAADFERVVGVLLGRRAATREVLPMLDPEGCSPWLAGPGEATLFVTVSVSGGSIRSLRSYSQFSFACPCGEQWASPAHDLCLLAEALSCLPSKPPPSLLKSSPLATLLLDAGSGQALPDVSMLVGVSRRAPAARRAAGGLGPSASANAAAAAAEAGRMERDVALVHSALSSLRLAASSV